MEIKEFIDKGKKNVKSSWSGYSWTAFKCPCCSHLTTFRDYYIHTNPYTDCYNNFLRHLTAIIRLSGNKEHMDLLFEMFGKEKALVILKKMAEKNMLVALAIKYYIESKSLKVKNEEII
jgi:hypothetical protein